MATDTEKLIDFSQKLSDAFSHLDPEKEAIDAFILKQFNEKMTFEVFKMLWHTLEKNVDADAKRLHKIDHCSEKTLSELLKTLYPEGPLSTQLEDLEYTPSSKTLIAIAEDQGLCLHTLVKKIQPLFVKEDPVYSLFSIAGLSKEDRAGGLANFSRGLLDGVDTAILQLSDFHTNPDLIDKIESSLETKGFFHAVIPCQDIDNPDSPQWASLFIYEQFDKRPQTNVELKKGGTWVARYFSPKELPDNEQFLENFLAKHYFRFHRIEHNLTSQDHSAELNTLFLFLSSLKAAAEPVYADADICAPILQLSIFRKRDPKHLQAYCETLKSEGKRVDGLLDQGDPEKMKARILKKLYPTETALKAALSHFEALFPKEDIQDLIQELLQKSPEAVLSRLLASYDNLLSSVRSTNLVSLSKSLDPEKIKAALKALAETLQHSLTPKTKEETLLLVLSLLMIASGQYVHIKLLTLTGTTGLGAALWNSSQSKGLPSLENSVDGLKLPG